MPRILGVDIPREKKTFISLTYLFGVGRTLSYKILEKAKVDPDKRAKDLTEAELSAITGVLQRDCKKREISDEIFIKILSA